MRSHRVAVRDWPVLVLVLLLAACSGPRQPAVAGSPVTRPAPTPSPTPTPAALVIVPLRVGEAVLPPAAPTSETVYARRETPTPAATAEAAWKYVTVDFAIENRADAARLVGIAGANPAATNLAAATLVAGDGKRYKPLASYSSFGQRTASGLSLTSYPVLLRLPPGFRAVAESFGTQSVQAPVHSSLTFKVPSMLTDYGTLTIPPLANLGPKTGDDDVSSRLRPLIGAIQPLELGAASSATQSVALPADATLPNVQPIGAVVSGPNQVSVTLTGIDTSNPADYQAVNHGWKQLSLSLRYRNDDAQQARAVNVAGWLFGADGVVYTGDVPAIGDFGRAMAAPQPSVLLGWDGRQVGADQLAAGQTQDGRRAVFLVPRDLHSAVLVLGGDVEALYTISEIAAPPAP